MQIFFPICVSVNIVILVLAVALFLLVLHHNFLGLSSLLRNEISGMGSFTNTLALVEDLEFSVSHILSYITVVKEKFFLLSLTQPVNESRRKHGRCSLCSFPCCARLLRV